MNTSCRCILAGAAVVLATPALAQPADADDAGALAAQLAALERLMSDAEAPLAEREAAQDEAIGVRRRLLASIGPRDERREPLAMRQGAALLDVLWRDGSGLAVLYGVPVFDQRARVLAAASEAERVLREFGDQGARLRAAALVLTAAASEEPAERARLAGEALSVAARARAQGVPVAGRVEAAATLLRGQRGDAERALIAFGALLEERDADESAPAAALVAERWFGWLRAGAAAAAPGFFAAALDRFGDARAGAPFVRGGTPDPLLTILAADVMTGALVDRWRSERDTALLRRAVLEQAALLERNDLGVPAETLRPLVFEKIARVVDGTMPLDELHPAAMLARAVTLTRQPESRSEAIGLLERLAGRPDAGAYAPEALWELAVILSSSPSPEDRSRAVGALTRLAGGFPAHVRAGEALGAALAYGRSLADTTPEPLRRSARAAYLEALELATEAEPPLENAELWKYDRARLLLEESPTATATQTALGLLESVEPGSEAGPAAEALYARTLERIIGQGVAAMALARTRHDPAAARRAAAELLPATRRGAAWAERRPGPAADRFLFAHAEALTESGSADGARFYRDLLDRGAQVDGGSASLRLGLARASLLAGRSADAFGVLRDLTAELDRTDPKPPVYWHAWTLMLEMLEADNADGSRSGTIRANVKRLELLDRGLGGEPWRSRIRRVGESAGQ